MDNNSDNTITFDENGFCSYCTYALERMPNVYFPNELGRNRLENLINKIKKDGRNRKYDCIMGLSGGLDSSYLAYIGYIMGLKILAFHIDDGYNTSIATENIVNLCKKCNIDLIIEKPDQKQFNDITLSFLKASLPGVCNPQDNLIISYLNENARKHKIKYFLSGANFALESILERSNGINAADGFHIKSINKQFGTQKIDKLPLVSLFQTYFKDKYIRRIKFIKPLDLMDYNKNKAISELNKFCGFSYYGGKHYENILTRFIQCYYLPEKFSIDKRKSHLSSLIISNQMTREEAISEIKKPIYESKELLDSDLTFILTKLNINKEYFSELIANPVNSHYDYPYSILIRFEKLARKYRKYLVD